jgi:hypothetical protein
LFEISILSPFNYRTIFNATLPVVKVDTGALGSATVFGGKIFNCTFPLDVDVGCVALTVLISFNTVHVPITDIINVTNTNTTIVVFDISTDGADGGVGV